MPDLADGQTVEIQGSSATDSLRKELTRIEALGGEGLMLRQPGSLYEAGRSHTLLKVKTFHDAEAIVIQHLPGSGRHKGRLGALLVKLPSGIEFSVGTGFSDAGAGAPASDRQPHHVPLPGTDGRQRAQVPIVCPCSPGCCESSGTFVLIHPLSFRSRA